MCEFRSLSPQTFKENSPENSRVFSQCLEYYFFKTKDENYNPPPLTNLMQPKIIEIAHILSQLLFSSIILNLIVRKQLLTY